jgi:YVTN family beta-propeller protein
MKHLIKIMYCLLILVTLSNCSQNNPPATPSAPSGQSTAEAHSYLSYTFSTTDPDGDDISYQFDWGDGNLSEWTDFIESGKPVSANYVWRKTGTYNIHVRAIDTKEGVSDWSEALPINIVICTNFPPNQPPAPSGIDSGFVHTYYTFNASTTDPEGDSISYQFDWGDGNLSYWSDFYQSGDTVSMQHYWNNSGVYSIRVHAKDINNSESDWSAEHQIQILSDGTPPPEDSFPDRVITTINVGDKPQGFDFLPNGEYAYVANCISDDIYVIKTSDHSVADIISIEGSGNARVAALPNGEYVYVTGHYDSCAYVIRTSDNTIIDTMKLGVGPGKIASLPNGEYVYATNTESDEVSVIRTSDNTVVATIPVGDDPRGLEVLPNGEYVYMGCMGPSRIDVIRTSDNTVVDHIYVSHWPHTLTAHPDGNYIYVTEDFGNVIYVIETSTNTWVNSITVGSEPKGIAVLPTGDYIYVSNRGSNSISVIRESDYTIVKTIPVLYAPLYIKCAPNGEFLYVTHGRSDIVTVIGY